MRKIKKLWEFKTAPKAISFLNHIKLKRGKGGGIDLLTIQTTGKMTSRDGLVLALKPPSRVQWILQPDLEKVYIYIYTFFSHPIGHIPVIWLNVIAKGARKCSLPMWLGREVQIWEMYRSSLYPNIMICTILPLDFQLIFEEVIMKRNEMNCIPST